MSNRRYDPDFKREAVRMAVEEGLGVREVQRSLGITFGILKGWVQKRRSPRFCWRLILVITWRTWWPRAFCRPSPASLLTGPSR